EGRLGSHPAAEGGRAHPADPGSGVDRTRPGRAFQGRAGSGMRFVPRQALPAGPIGGGDPQDARERQGCRDDDEGSKVGMPGIEKLKGVARKSRKGAPSARKSARPASAAAKEPSRREGENGNGNLRQQSDARGKYVYCIIQASEPLRFGPLGIGIEPAEVHTVNYREIAAVVSDTPMEVHDPTRENVLAHERVNETVTRKHPVIPMSFRT